MGDAGKVGRAPDKYDELILLDLDKKLRAGAHDKLLDVGSGMNLAKGVQSGLTISLDIAYSMAKSSGALYAVVGTADHLPIMNLAMDRIIAYSVVQYMSLSEVSGLFAEISRCLAREGRCLIGDIPIVELRSVHRRLLRWAAEKSSRSQLFQYFSRKWLLSEADKVDLHGTFLKQDEGLPFSALREDLLLTK